MEALRMHLFGGFLLERNGVAVPPIASRAGRSLLAYLVVNRDGPPVLRDHISGTFWPDMSESKARRRLSQTLWQIQDAIHEGAESHLTVTPDSLSFDTSKPYWLDVEEFERSFSAAESGGGSGGLDMSRLQRCVDLYRGDFLAGFYDDWVRSHQDYYRLRYLVAVRQLIDAAKANGAYEEALVQARRLTHHDPIAEEIHREVMRLYFLLGRSREAIEQYERCRSILAEELGTVPSQETTELYQRILRHKKAGLQPIRSEEPAVVLNARVDAPFVGRDEERRRMVDGMERVLSGTGGVILVEGEPGVGKSRLVTEAADDAQWRGFQVSWGACTEGTLRPFAPLAQLLESLTSLRVDQLGEQVAPLWLEQAMRLIGRGGDGPLEEAHLRPDEASTRMQSALVNTLVALGKTAPHMIIIDDVQWADADTLKVLTKLGPHLARNRILLVAVYRSEEARSDPQVWDVLRELDRAAGIRRVVLTPLSVFELDEMVKRVIGISSLEPRVSTELHKRTGGNALFTLETLFELRDQGMFDGSHPAQVLHRELHGQRLPLAPRVKSVIDSRLSLLCEKTAQIYRSAAVAGEPADLDLLSEISGFPRSTVADAVDDLLHRGLLREAGEGRFRIAHDQVRQVVYDEMDAEERRSIHRRIGEHLERLVPLDVEAVAYHFSNASDLDRAAGYLRDAGHRAVGLNAFATAGDYLESAREAAGEADWDFSQRMDILFELEDVLGVLGRRDTQRSVIDEIRDLGRDNSRIEADADRRMAMVLAHNAEFGKAEEAGLRSVERSRIVGDEQAISESLVALGTTLRWEGRPLDAVPLLEEAVAVSAGGSRENAEAHTELASTLVEVLRSSDGMEQLRPAAHYYESTGDLRGMAEVAGIEARAEVQQGHTQQARAAFEHAIELCERIGYRHGHGVNLINLALLEHLQGRVANAMPRYELAGEIWADLENARGQAMALANSASARHNLLGEDGRAESDARHALELFEEIGDHARKGQCLEILAGIQARSGDEAEAKRMLEASLEELAGTGNRFLEVQHLRSLSLLLIEMNDIDEAMRRLDAASEICEGADLPALAVEIDSIRGLAYLAAGKTEQALRQTGNAVAEMVEGVERPYLIHHRHSLAAMGNGAEDEARKSGLLAMRALEDTLDGLPEDQLRHAFDDVPEHAAILANAQKLAPRTIEVELPLSEAPSGRPLGRDDLRVVRWTIDHPEDAELTSPVEQRRHKILRLIDEATESGTSPSLDHIARVLGVSASTIRRDLAALRDDGYDVVTRGNREPAAM